MEAGASTSAGNARVARFSPGSEGEAPQFREAWGWGDRRRRPGRIPGCGPAYAVRTPPANAFPTCKPAGTVDQRGEQTGHFNGLSGLAVDQATGDVYVLNIPRIPGGVSANTI